MAITDGILARIRHAEGWLRRARSDYERGDARQAVLRLLLAEAEIRRAREAGASIAAGPRRPSGVPSWVVLGAVAAAGLLVVAVALARPFVSGPVAAVPRVIRAAPAAQGPNGVLRFESGRVLPFVGIPVVVRPDGRTAPGVEGGVDVPSQGSPGDLLLNGDDGPALVTFH